MRIGAVLLEAQHPHTVRPSTEGITSSTRTSVLPGDPQGLGPVCRGEHLVPLEIEGSGERITDGAVVVDQEHAVGHGGHLVG